MKTLHNIKNKLLSFAAVMAAALTLADNVQAQPTGQWDFNGGNLAASVGDALQYSDGTTGPTEMGTVFGSNTILGISDINGTPAKVMGFPNAINGMGYLMPTPANPNGGGSLVNDYTLIFDVLYPKASSGQLRPLLDTDGTTFVPGPDIVVDASNGIGVTPSGPYFGSLATNTWYRIAFVVQQDQNTIVEYINGASVGVNSISGTQAGVDGRFALEPGSTALILGSALTNAAPGYVSSIQIRDVALNAGQMKALGAPSASKIPQTIPPVPSFIDSRTPDVNTSAVTPEPSINVVLNQGDTTVDGSSIKLYMDGTLLPANITPSAPTFTIDYAVTSILRPLSTHELDLVYSDSVVGLQTNSWLFKITDYQNVTLPAPIYMENFDEVAEGGIPDGWTVTNWTDSIDAGLNLADVNSDSYLNWVAISVTDYTTYYPWTDDYISPGFPEVSGNRRMMIPPIVENGVLLTSLASGNLIVAESDQRGGSQVQVIFTKDYDLTGHTNVYLSFHHINEQNQDNICSVEYSIDHGVTWQPLLYMFDDGTTDGDGSDVVTNSSTKQIDVNATFNTARNDQAHGLAYGNFIGAAITTNLIPYIRGCRNDDPVQQKRIEVFHLPLADNQPAVRFRFMEAGTASWFFDIDDVGIYSINTPVITQQPQSQTVDAGTMATITVGATGSGTFAYQWELNGKSISGATNSSYIIPIVSPSDAGLYDVIVSNADGPTTSGSAQLTVVTTPQIATQPVSQVADSGDTVSLSATYRGARPIRSYWQLNGVISANSGSTDVVNTLTLNGITTNLSGSYLLIITNNYGAITSSVAQVAVVTGSITNGLVVHLTFDGDLADASGRGNNASYAYNGVSGDPNPTFVPGKIGQAFEFTTLADGSKFDYATLGYPADLQFGDSQALSISMWVNYTNQSDDLPFISNKNWNSSGNGGWGIFPQSAGDFRVNFTGPSGGADKLDFHPTTVLRDGHWHNVVLSIARAPLSQACEVYTYVDGSPLDQRVMTTQGTIDTLNLPFTNQQGPGGNPLPTAQTNWAVNIGQDGTGVYHDQGSAYNIAAHIDDVGIWRRALTAKEAYAIYTAGQAGKDLSQAVTVAAVPPTISSDPLSQVVSAGGDVALSITPGGTPPFSFAWQKDGTAIPSATSSNLTLTAVSTNAAGNYLAIVSNSGGSATSHVAQVSVYVGTITQDLVLHLKFDGDYTDSTGRGNNASAVGSPVFAPGKLGQALEITTTADGSTINYATLGYPADLKFDDTNNFSIGFWVNYTNQMDDPPFISNKNWNSSNNRGWGIFSQDGGNFRINVTGTNGGSDKMSTTSTPTIRDGSWHHIMVAFWRGHNVQTYVDGQSVNVTALPTVGNVDTDDLGYKVNIGQDGTGDYTDGGSAAIIGARIDDVGIWRRIVTPQEDLAIYTVGQSGKDLSQAGQTVTVVPLSATRTGGNLKLDWAADPTVKLQETTTLNSPNWTDVPGTLGTSSYMIPATNRAAFYRLSQ